MSIRMNKTTLRFRAVIIACLVTCAIAIVMWKPKAAFSQEVGHLHRYEYASVRYMGGQQTTFNWPDGTSEKLSSLSKVKRPNNSDERMFYLTIAVNILASKGYEFIN